MTIVLFLLAFVSPLSLSLSVNDAPALHAANVGVAMGSGTAVAQQASKMVIVDDDFCTIVVAVRHGRAIYANIQKFVLFLLGTNTVQVVLILAAVAAGLIIPLTPLSIFYINVATDGLASVALSIEHGESELMTMPPRRAKEPILHGQRVILLIGHSIGLACAVTLCYLIGLWWFTGNLLATDMRVDDGLTPNDYLNNCSEYVNLSEWRTLDSDQCKDGISRARSMVFIVMVLSEVLRGYTVRNFLKPVWHGFFDNRVMAIGSLFSIGLALLFMLTPGTREVFGLTNSLPYFGWLVAIGSVLVLTMVDEYIKLRVYGRNKKRRYRLQQDTNFQKILNELQSVNHKLSEIILHQVKSEQLIGNKNIPTLSNEAVSFIANTKRQQV